MLLGSRRAVVDLTPADFKTLRKKLSTGRGPVWLGNEIGRVHSVFRYAFKAELIERPVRFGPSFEKPSAKVLRANRQKNGPRMFKREEVVGFSTHGQRQRDDSAGVNAALATPI